MLWYQKYFAEVMNTAIIDWQIELVSKAVEFLFWSEM